MELSPIRDMTASPWTYGEIAPPYYTCVILLLFLSFVSAVVAGADSIVSTSSFFVLNKSKKCSSPMILVLEGGSFKQT